MGGVTIDIVIQNNMGNFYNIAAQAGCRMKRYVLIQVREKSSIKATALDLTFTGSELTVLDSHDSRHTARHIIYLKKIPINDISIFQQNGQQNATIAPGQYRVPFSLQLPSHLPRSMSESHGNSSCSIDYKLKAILKGSGTMWNYNHQVPVQVLAKPRDPQQTPPSPQLAAPVNEKVHAYCCINRGSMSLGGQVDETRLYRGAKCTVHMSCRNYSTAKPLRVQARLRQEIKWQVSRGGSRSCVDNVVAVDFPTILHSLQHEPRRQQRFPGVPLVQNEYQEMYHEIAQGIHRGTFRVPPSVYNTYAGHLITVTHRLELVIQTGCCISNPSVSIPLYIDEPPNANAPRVAPAEVSQAPAAIVPGTNDLPVIQVPSSSVYPVATGMTASLTLQDKADKTR